MSDRARIANFDILARPYRWLEYFSFGPLLMRCRREYLAELVRCRHALVLGDGDGRFLATLLAAAPELHAHVIDSSEAMLRILSRRVAEIGASHRVVLQRANAVDFEPSGRSYDLVVSHFFLDCLDDGEVTALLQRIVPNISSKISSDALWVVSEFAIPARTGWRKSISLAARAVIQLLYYAFGLATGLRVRTLPDYASAMRRQGFQRKACRNRLGGMLVSELWTLESGPGGPGMSVVPPIVTIE